MNSWTKLVVVSLMLFTPVFTQTAAAATKTFSGGHGDPPNDNWENLDNWVPAGVPGPSDDVVIEYADQVDVTESATKEINSLDVHQSATIQGAEGTSVDIKAGNNISIGVSAEVNGGAGGDSQDGGDVVLESTGGDVTIGPGASLNGGTGGNGSITPGDGGDVKTNGNKVTNDGEENAGDGGDRIGGNGDGGKGGDVRNGGWKRPEQAGPAKKPVECHPGKKNPGEGGERAGTGKKGEDGDTYTEAKQLVSISPGDFQSGRRISIEVGLSGTLVMAGLTENTLDADSIVNISACPQGTIDLTGNSPGTNVVVAGSKITILAESIQLDPGVTLADIMEPDPIVLYTDVPSLTEWGLIIFGVVLLGFITWVFLKRRKVVAVKA